MPIIRAFLLSLLLVCPVWAETISVAAAISLREAMNQIGDAYSAETGDKVEFTFGSSGQLMGQIKAGAPIDLFISAANKQVDDLITAGLADDSTRRIVTTNTLVLIVPGDSKISINNFNDLSKPEVLHIAAGEPKTVPAGQYAEQVFKSFNLSAAIKDKLVYGTNVRQVLDYVERGEVTAGVVYKTDAMESGNKVKVVAVARPRSHEPIVYPAVVVKASVKRAAAIRFLDYLAGKKGRQILNAMGFTEPKPARPAAPTTSPSALRIEGEVPTPRELTPQLWAKLPRQSVHAKDHDGQEHTFEGVALADVLGITGLHVGATDLRGSGLTRYLVVEAADGYRVLFALPELSPDFSDRNVLLVDRRDGEPLSERAGPFQVIVPNEKRQARWVRQVVCLRIAEAVSAAPLPATTQAH